MSIKIMSWVWDNSPYEGKQLLIHLSLADWAGDNGICWPKQETIAKKCRCSVETVRTTTRTFQNDGFLEIVEESKGRGMSHRYKLLAPKSFGELPKQPDSSYGETQIKTGKTQIQDKGDPNPSPKNHQEPSITISKAQCPYCHKKINIDKPHNCSAMNQLMR